MKELELQLTLNKDRISSLEKEKSKAEGDLIKLKKQLDFSKEEIGTHKNTNASLQRETDRLEKKVEELERKVELLEVEIDEKSDEDEKEKTANLLKEKENEIELL